jgi:hypothetical protein
LRKFKTLRFTRSSSTPTASSAAREEACASSAAPGWKQNQENGNQGSRNWAEQKAAEEKA